MIDISLMTDDEYEKYLDSCYKMDIVNKLDNILFLNEIISLQKEYSKNESQTKFEYILSQIKITPYKGGYNLYLNINITNENKYSNKV
jgi:hypothetical protein